MKYLVINSGENLDGSYWAIIQNKINNIILHGILRTFDQKIKNTYIEIPHQVERYIKWEVSSLGYKNINPPKEYNCLYGYHKNSVLDFGIFEGYELGIVYAFDAPYLEWCIFNIGEFFMLDLEELEQIGILVSSEKFEIHREIHNVSGINMINTFKSIQDLTQEVRVLNRNFRFEIETIRMNDFKLKKYCPELSVGPKVGT